MKRYTMNLIDELGVRDIVRNALKEDIGRKDITTESIIPAGKLVSALFLAKEDCVVCGLGVAALVFKLCDESVKLKFLVREGAFIKKGKGLARIMGKARSILAAERVALNFLCLLSGISTKTRKLVDAVRPYKVKIVDTRKTIPGLRLLQKYAVRIGGGYNHRMKLDEMFLVKDNHLKIIKDLGALTGLDKKYELEIEVKNLKEFNNALKLMPDIIMLDNMGIKEIKKAVRIRNSLSKKAHHRAPKLEASGGVTLKNIRKIASCGVDIISVGALTHSVDSVDISLEIL